MMTFRQYIDEGIEDKGIMKAIFVVGIPGSGKSHTIREITGTIRPKVVNTDKATEFLGKKFDMTMNKATWDSFFKDRTKPITLGLLSGYLNGMLPLFIDGTSNNTGNILARVGILKSLGYDTGMVFINTDLDVAKARAKERGEKTDRHVSDSFIEQVHDLSVKNKKFFQSEFHFFREVNNNPGELDDAAILSIYKEVSGFYTDPIDNPVGQRTFEELREKKQKYLVPTILTKEELDNKVKGWYR